MLCIKLIPLPLLLFSITFISLLPYALQNSVDDCRICQFLAKTFLEGLSKTEKLHFGGGNTDWEERKLGRFKTSETRFVEIMEYTCKKETVGGIDLGGIKNSEFKCHSIAENNEDLLERWFFEYQENGPNLEQFLCVDNLRRCCSDGHFGRDCAPCPGVKNSGKSCFGRGTCQGSGTRTGDGTCACHIGYVGKMCSNCDSNYFAVEQNSTFIECKECFDGCSGGCKGDGPTGCSECRSGYITDAEFGCKDIDECVTDNRCKGSNEKCLNTQGSYECLCIDGYKRANSGECELDVEEKGEESHIEAEELVSEGSGPGAVLLDDEL